MNKQQDASVQARTPKCSLRAVAASLVSATVLPATVLAQDFGGADGKVTRFFENINGLLNIASIAVVTIAVIFAGYQIAFAHKRVGDVAPILIGGFLIGAAAQIARMLLGDGAGGAVTMVDMVLSVHA